MAKDKKFLALLEKYQSRFETKGFLVGDVVKFDKDFKSKDSYKSMNDNVKELIDSYIDSGLHIRVTSVDGGNDLVIAQDHGGGRFVGKVTIPTSFVSPVDFGDNLPPLPEVTRRDDEVQIKPVEVPALPTDTTEADSAVPTEGEGANDTNPHLKEEDEEEVVAENTSYTQHYMG